MPISRITSHTLKLVDTVLHIFLKIHHLVIICLIHQRGMNHKISSRHIIGNRYIIHLSDTEQRLDIRIMRLCCQRIGKEYEENRVNEF